MSNADFLLSRARTIFFALVYMALVYGVWALAGRTIALVVTGAVFVCTIAAAAVAVYKLRKLSFRLPRFYIRHEPGCSHERCFVVAHRGTTQSYRCTLRPGHAGPHAWGQEETNQK